MFLCVGSDHALLADPSEASEAKRIEFAKGATRVAPWIATVPTQDPACVRVFFFSSTGVCSMCYKASTVKRGAKAAARARRLSLKHPARANLSTYTADQSDFLRAVDAFRRENDRPFLCATDYLMVAESLGWVRTPAKPKR